MEQKLLESIYDLTDEIKESDPYQRLLVLHELIEKDEELQKLIKIFNDVKHKYEEVSKHSHYHPDYDRIKKEMQTAKYNLYTNELIKEYKIHEKQIQKTLDDISRSIAKSVSDRLKAPNEIGLLKKWGVNNVKKNKYYYLF